MTAQIRQIPPRAVSNSKEVHLPNPVPLAGPAQVPGEPLFPGDVVLVVDTPRSGEDPPAETPEAIEATVLQTYPPTGP